jgi:hypothetical protein
VSLLEETLGFSVGGAVVSTAEHADPFNIAVAPTFLLPQLVLNRQTDAPTSILILAASIVSTGNEGYPRGFLLPEPLEGHRRFNMLRDRDRGRSLSWLPPKVMDDFQSSPALTRAFFEKYDWLAPLFRGTTGWASYADQMATIMTSMADAWMGGRPHGMRVALQEDVARRMLMRLIEDEDPNVRALLFDDPTRNCLREAFRRVPHAGIGGPGTFLFWGRSEEGKDVRLDESGGLLRGRGFEAALKASVIHRGLAQRTLWPGLFLSLLCVSWLPGLSVVGGIRQTLYWPLMVDILNSLLGGDREGAAFNIWGYSDYRIGGIRGLSGNPIEVPEKGTGLFLADLVRAGETISDVLATPYPDPEDLDRLRSSLPGA